MKAPAIIILLTAGILLSLSASWIPIISLPFVALAVAWITVARGRSVGATAGLVAGVILDVLTRTPGRWSIALPISAVVCDLLHRGVLSHPAPGVPGLLAGATASTATFLAGNLAYLVPFLTNTRAYEPLPLTLLGVSALSGIESAALVVLARILTRSLRRSFASLFYARQPL